MFLKPFILFFVIGFFVTAQSQLNLRYLLCQSRCPLEYEPICASDGKVYSSVCQFKCERIRNAYLDLRSIGLCDDSSACSAARNNVTGCGKKITNILTKLYREDCSICTCKKKGKPIACICTAESKPVCGSDGKNYGNICGFRQARMNNPSLMILSPVKCMAKHNSDKHVLSQLSKLYDHDCGPINLIKKCPREPGTSSSSTK